MGAVNVHQLSGLNWPSGRLRASNAKWFFNPAYNPDIIDWHKRFKRESEQFEVDEKVALFATISEETPGTFTFTAKYNPTMADTFTLVLPPENEDAKELRKLQSGTLLAVLQVKQLLGQGEHYAWRYSCDHATIIAFPTNPEPQEVANMAFNTVFLVEGRLEEFSTSRLPSRSGDTRDRMLWAATLQHANGRLTVIDYGSSISLDGGVLEHLANQDAEAGETIRFFCRKDRIEVFCQGDAYLAKPSAERISRYTADRMVVATEQTALRYEIQQGNWRQARERFARVRQTQLTLAEFREWRKLIAELPEEEQPIIGSEPGLAKKLQESYGFNPETLSKQEYLAKAHAWFTPQGATGSDTMQRYALDILEGNLNDKEKNEFFAKTLEAVTENLRDDPEHYRHPSTLFYWAGFAPDDLYVGAVTSHLDTLLNVSKKMRTDSYKEVCEALLRIKPESKLLRLIGLDEAVTWLGRIHQAYPHDCRDLAAKLVLAVHQAHRA